MTVDLKMIKDAAKNLENISSLTPIYTSRRMKENLYMKMENFQHTGSFKLRGAYNKISNLTEEEKQKGVITSSAGNHAQGVALSATEQGIESYICIPSIAPLAKINATKSYGGNVIIVPGSFEDAKKKSYELRDERDLTYVHPFDDEFVIAGQGTIGLEIMDQLPDVDVVLAPIGGGGLLAGIAVAVKSINPEVQVIGVEAEKAACMKESLDCGGITSLESCQTIADGIAVGTPGTLTYELTKKYVDDIVTVTEAEISSAILEMLEYSKVMAEGAGATAVAAVLYDKLDLGDQKVCAVVSGGNINVNTMTRIINRGLFETGRMVELHVELTDKPGQLVELLEIIRDSGANILSIAQHSQSQLQDMDHAAVRAVLETFDTHHVNHIKKLLKEKGYKLISKDYDIV